MKGLTEIISISDYGNSRINTRSNFDRSYEFRVVVFKKKDWYQCLKLKLNILQCMLMTLKEHKNFLKNISMQNQMKSIIT